MNYKIISESIYKQLLEKENTEEINLYSFYRFGVEKYLDKKLYLTDLNNNFKRNNLGIANNSIYKEISNLNLEYVYIMNNFYLNKLANEDLKTLKEIYNKKDLIELENLVNKTYKKIIDNNGILKIGVSVKEDSRITNFLKEKSNTYLEILNIPVNFINVNNEEELTKKYPKYLPLGSIVLLKEATKRLMITGYTIIDLENKDKRYDYIGCLYPEGNIDTKTNIVFNHEDIKKIIALGLKTKESDDFMKEILKNID